MGHVQHLSLESLVKMDHFQNEPPLNLKGTPGAPKGVERGQYLKDQNPAVRMSALGRKQTFAPQNVMSALAPKADMCGALAHVCFGPIADKCPPGNSTTPSPRDPFGSDHARAISLRPSITRSMDETARSVSRSMSSTRGGVSWSSKTRPAPSAQTASIWGSCLGSSEPESFEMLRLCQSIRARSLCERENQATFATRSPTAIRNIRPFRPRRKQIPETSRSGTSTTRLTRSGFLFDLPFLTMGEGLLRSALPGQEVDIHERR